MNKYAFLSDFDGTISDDDFFYYTAEAFFNDNAFAPWREYLTGKKTHFDALKDMFASLRLSKEDFDRFISGVRVDPKARSVFALCYEKNIPTYIASAGCDYYIKALIGEWIKTYNILLLANSGEYNQTSGLTLKAPDINDPFYDRQTGVSKYKLAKTLKDQGYTLIFAGDGLPDFESAKIADVVFARKMLLEKCREARIETQDFNDFGDIEYFINNIKDIK
jgi:2,3-diketo-5-methylthio-1-phosphopentane phosphatase